MRTCLLLLIALLCACDDPTGPRTTLGAGSYDWISSTGGVTGSEITPDDLGFDVRLQFLTTVEGAAVRVYHDEELVAESRYTLEPDPQHLGPRPMYRLTLLPSPGVFPFALEGPRRVEIVGANELLFQDPCCDGYTHRFIRLASLP